MSRWAGLAVAVVACSAPPPHVAGIRSIEASPLPGPAPARVIVPGHLGAYWPIVGSDGTTYVVAGTFRVDVSGDTKFAEDAFATAIAASAEVADGAWLFAAVDGSVARAPTFLGKLERIGEVPRSIKAVGPS